MPTCELARPVHRAGKVVGKHEWRGWIMVAKQSSLGTPELERSGLVITIEPWDDPALCQPLTSFDPRSRYVERFWLPVLGPTSTWLLRRFADELEDHPGGARLDLAQAARSLGLESNGAPRSPMWRSIGRCLHFGLARWRTFDRLAVRPRVPLVWRRQLLRLPAALQIEHRDWVAALAAADPSARRRRQAKLVASDLRELGVDQTAIERHLLRQGAHPAVAYDAARWAWSETAQLD
jgi:hypothetical protein